MTNPWPGRERLDGIVGDVEFLSERWTGVLEPLNDPAYFAQAAVDPEAGTVAWPGGHRPSA